MSFSRLFSCNTLRAVCLIFLLSGGFFPCQAAALEKVKLAQFSQSKFLLYLPLYVAQEEGFFAKEGLDVDLIFAGNDDQIFAAVLSGSADYGMGDPLFTAIANAKGASTKTVAMLITNLALRGYTNNKDIPHIDALDQLAGLRMGSFPAPSTTYTILEDMKRTHPKLARMQIVQGGVGMQRAMLEAGKTDIAIDLEPAVSMAEHDGARVVFDMFRFTPPMAVTGLTTRQEIIDKKPDQVRRMVRAMQNAITAMYADHAVAYRTAEKLFPNLPAGVARRAVDHMLADAMYPRSVVIPDALWQKALQMRLASGDLKKPQATDFAVDNRFAESAQKGKTE